VLKTGAKYLEKEKFFHDNAKPYVNKEIEACLKKFQK
jgi:hypothetical protein